MNAVTTAWKKQARLLSRRDPSLREIIATVGEPTLTFKQDRYRALAESILSQQLATTAARSIINRFRALSPPFPKPHQVLQWDITELRAVGISGQKAGYLKALSEKFQDKAWLHGWRKLDDEALVARLVEVKGIGTWTAHMFLIFSQGRLDVLPVGDYGIRRGLQLLRGLKALPSPTEMEALTEKWRTARSVGSWYLWQALDRKLLR